MKCVTPMFRIYYPDDPEATGKIIGRQQAMQMLEADHNTIRKRIIDYNNNRKPNEHAWQLVPCRKCWACQLNYSAEWATRIMLEAKKTPGCNFFVTLTYDEGHLPIAQKIETENEVYENDGTWNGTLHEPDMVRFLNSLRKNFERQGYEGIKYFYCGEYGEKGRPHYHIILLHCPIDIRQFYDCHVDTNYKAHWKSHQLEKYWKEGILDISELEWSCAAYVARYCTKKISFDSDKTIYYKQGKMPEFRRMSKGIGFEWYEQHKGEIYKTDEIIMRTIKGNVGSAKPPKAFDRKFKEHFPQEFEKIRISRQTAAERATKMLNSLSDYTDYENLILSAEKVKKKMQMLPRVGEY